MRNPSRPWHRNAVQKAVVYALMGALVLPVNFSAHAANHALTAVADVNTIDYVVNVDWDYDSPPTQANNPNQRLDRDYIMAVLRVAAQSIFTMTEGRHRIGNVFIYRNKQFGQNVNIQMINTDDRSAANVGGFGTRNATSLNHLSFQKSPESINALGKVIAHELGHYTYGLLDEYVEEGKALDPKDFGSPSGTDNPKNTIMNNHLGFVSLSTPTDYADPATRQTAQARVYATGTGLAGGSAWETLTRPADQDPAGARGYTRTFFEAFRGINPNTLQLTRPVDGFDAKLNFIFAPNPVFRDVLIVDRSLPADRFASLIQAAKALVSQAGANTQFAVVVSPGAAAPVLGYTASTIEGKAAIVSALDAITPDTASTFDGLAAFTQSLNLLAAVRQRGDMSTLHVLTGTEATLPVEAATSARTARVSVNPLGITGGSPAQGVQRREQARAGEHEYQAGDEPGPGEHFGGLCRGPTGGSQGRDEQRDDQELHPEQDHCAYPDALETHGEQFRDGDLASARCSHRVARAGDVVGRGPGGGVSRRGAPPAPHDGAGQGCAHREGAKQERGREELHRGRPGVPGRDGHQRVVDHRHRRHQAQSHQRGHRSQGLAQAHGAPLEPLRGREHEPQTRERQTEHDLPGQPRGVQVAEHVQRVHHVVHVQHRRAQAEHQGGTDRVQGRVGDLVDRRRTEPARSEHLHQAQHDERAHAHLTKHGEDDHRQLMGVHGFRAPQGWPRTRYRTRWAARHGGG